MNEERKPEDGFKIRSVKFNFLMNFILTASSIVFPLITYPYVARILMAGGNGKVAFATSVISYFAMFASLGIPSYGIRCCAQVRDDRLKLTRVVHELLGINLLTTALAYGAFFLSLLFVARFQADKTLLVVTSATILLNTIGVSWFYAGLEQYSYITLCNIGFKILSIIGMFLLVHQPEDYVVYAGITVFASGGSNLMNFFRLRKYVALRPVGGYQFRRHFKPVLVFFATSVAISIYTNLDTVMLGFMKTDTDVGLYNAAIKVKTLLVSLVTSMGSVMLPRLSVCVKKQENERFFQLVSKNFQFLLTIALPLTVFFILFARDSILFLSGSGFVGAIQPMKLLMPTVFIIALSNMTGLQILVPMGRERAVMISVIGGGIVDFMMNLIFIPRLAATGAALSTMSAELTVLLIQIYFIRAHFGFVLKKVTYYKGALGLAAAGIAGFLVAAYCTFDAFMRLVVGAFVFFGVYFGLLLMMKDAFLWGFVCPLVDKIKKKRG